MALIRFVDDKEPSPERLAKAKAALAEVEKRKEVAPVAASAPPPKAVSVPEKKAEVKRSGFDRNAYHKAYMREYMRKRRARSGPAA